MTPSIAARRPYAYGLTLILVALVISPALRDPPVDSFPLSDYPMFSHGRPSPEMTLTHAHGVSEDGARQALSPLVSSGNREVLQSMMTIGNEVHAGRSVPFCREVAQRVAAEPDLAHIAYVELLTSTFDSIAYFEEGPEPLHRELHHRCRVER